MFQAYFTLCRRHSAPEASHIIKPRGIMAIQSRHRVLFVCSSPLLGSRPWRTRATPSLSVQLLLVVLNRQTKSGRQRTGCYSLPRLPLHLPLLLPLPHPYTHTHTFSLGAGPLALTTLPLRNRHVGKIFGARIRPMAPPQRGKVGVKLASPKGPRFPPPPTLDSTCPCSSKRQTENPKPSPTGSLSAGLDALNERPTTKRRIRNLHLVSLSLDFEHAALCKIRQ